MRVRMREKNEFMIRPWWFFGTTFCTLFTCGKCGTYGSGNNDQRVKIPQN